MPPNPAPSDGERGDSMLLYTALFRPATKLTWEMKQVGVNRSRKMGAMLPPSANPQVTQEEWRSLNSDGNARRDNLSP
jgi:hypothetical protein